MKKIYSLLFGLLIAVTGVGLFYSCEWWTEDDEITYNLEGTWSGDMYFASYYDGNWYYSNYTTLEFIERDYNRGEGYWVDYYSQAPWDYVANHFIWEVKYGVIYIRFIDKHSDYYDYRIEIRDFEIDRHHFSGDVFYEGEERHFDLEHTASPNWNEYHYGWNYGDDYHPSWHSNRRDAAGDNVAADSAENGDGAGKAPAECPKRVLVPANGKLLVMK